MKQKTVRQLQPIKNAEDLRNFIERGEKGHHDGKRKIFFTHLKPAGRGAKSIVLTEQIDRYNDNYTKLVRMHERRHIRNAVFLKDLKKFPQRTKILLEMHDEFSAFLAELLYLRSVYMNRKTLPNIQYYRKYREYLISNSLDVIPSEFEINLLVQETFNHIKWKGYSKLYTPFRKKRSDFSGRPPRAEFSFDEIVKHLYDFSHMDASFNILNLLPSDSRDEFFTKFNGLVLENYESRPTFWGLMLGRQQIK